jgi:integral membrane protein (TIGR01906 family)
MSQQDDPQEESQAESLNQDPLQAERTSAPSPDAARRALPESEPKTVATEVASSAASPAADSATASPAADASVSPAADASAHALDQQPEPQIFESDDFAGATPPPSLQERAAQMRRERLKRYEAAHSVEDSGPETQAMPPVPAADTDESGELGTGDEPLDVTGPIQEPQEAPFAARSVLSAPAPSASSAAERAEAAQKAGVPGVTDDSEFAAEPQPSRIFSRILQWVVAVLTPFVILIAAVRAVASGAFMWLEYHRPGFPMDDYGFTTKQRTTLGSYGLDYINGFAGKAYLGDLQAPSGTRTLAEPKLFKSTEVAHMADVQSLIHLAYLVACLGLLVIVISLLVLRVRYAGGVRRGLFAGAWATLGVLLVLGVLGALGWNTFFTDFHKLFFSGGNWEFYMDDTLIRLYPPQFWVDAAVVLAGIGAIVSVVLLILTWPTRSRRAASRNKQNARLYRMG